MKEIIFQVACVQIKLCISNEKKKSKIIIMVPLAGHHDNCKELIIC